MYVHGGDGEEQRSCTPLKCGVTNTPANVGSTPTASTKDYFRGDLKMEKLLTSTGLLLMLAPFMPAALLLVLVAAPIWVPIGGTMLAIYALQKRVANAN